jgi:hypothetical protein
MMHQIFKVLHEAAAHFSKGCDIVVHKICNRYELGRVGAGSSLVARNCDILRCEGC